MKSIIYTFFILFLFSCGLKENHEGHDHATEENKVETKVNKAEHSHTIHLNEAQIKAAEIKTDVITNKPIRDRIHVTGVIEVPPQNKVTIYAPMEAFVYSSNLLPGDEIKKGQIVATLQHPNFAKIQYSYLEAINNKNVLKADYNRKKMLLENDIASKKSFEIAESTYKSAKSLVNSLAAQLKMSGLNPSTIASKGIQQYVYIKSPIAGFVVDNNLNKGKFLAANEEMMEIIDTDHMHAEMQVFNTDVIKIKKGTDFVFKPTGLDVTYSGYVKLINQAVNETSKTINVHGHFEDEKGLLKAGTFINAEILTEAQELKAVPTNAIIEIEGENFIFKVAKADEFVPVKVTIGNSDKGFTAIKTIDDNNYNIKIVTKGAHVLKGKLLELSGNMESGHAH